MLRKTILNNSYSRLLIKTSYTIPLLKYKSQYYKSLKIQCCCHNDVNIYTSQHNIYCRQEITCRKQCTMHSYTNLRYTGTIIEQQFINNTAGNNITRIYSIILSRECNSLFHTTRTTTPLSPVNKTVRRPAAGQLMLFVRRPGKQTLSIITLYQWFIQ